MTYLFCNFLILMAEVELDVHKNTNKHNEFNLCTPSKIIKMHLDGYYTVVKKTGRLRYVVITSPKQIVHR